MSEIFIEPSAQLELPLGINIYEQNLLDQLLSNSRLYNSSKEFMELLDFTVRLRNMAPFNAMLLHIQRPGMTFAASAHDWLRRFQRTVKDKSRPLLIMWPFGPVVLVYDLLDTEGADLPEDAFAYCTAGNISDMSIAMFTDILATNHIRVRFYDQGDNDPGYIARLTASKDAKTYSTYELGVNRNHGPAMSFVTLAHELGHLFLGHLGNDRRLNIQGRRLDYHIQEIEAESVAYIVCNRNGVECLSGKYLSDYIEDYDNIQSLDLYAIMRAAGRIERLLRLTVAM